MALIYDHVLVPVNAGPGRSHPFTLALLGVLMKGCTTREVIIRCGISHELITMIGAKQRAVTAASS